MRGVLVLVALVATMVVTGSAQAQAFRFNGPFARGVRQVAQNQQLLSQLQANEGLQRQLLVQGQRQQIIRSAGLSSCGQRQLLVQPQVVQPLYVQPLAVAPLAVQPLYVQPLVAPVQLQQVPSCQGHGLSIRVY